MPLLPAPLLQSLDGEGRDSYVRGYWSPPGLKPETLALCNRTLELMYQEITPAPWAEVVKLLARLRMHKPTQAKDEVSVSVMLEDIADDLGKFCLAAVTEGIADLRRNDPDPFFPTSHKLIEYIYPVHWKYQRRLERLQETVARAETRQLDTNRR